MAHISEYEVETKFIDRLESIGYEYVELKNYDDVINNFRDQLTRFNEAKIKEAKGSAALSDAEFERVLIYLDNKSVYESAKILRDKYVLSLDNGKTVYLDFFSSVQKNTRDLRIGLYIPFSISFSLQKYFVWTELDTTNI